MPRTTRVEPATEATTEDVGAVDPAELSRRVLEALAGLDARLSAIESSSQPPPSAPEESAAAEHEGPAPCQPAAGSTADAATEQRAPPAPPTEPLVGVDPRQFVAELPAIYDGVLPPRSQRSPGLFRPRTDEAYRYLTEHDLHAVREEYLHHLCYGLYLEAADAAYARAVAALQAAHPPTADTADAWDMLAAAAETRAAAAAATADRIDYIRRFKARGPLTDDERVAQRLIQQQCFGTAAADAETSRVGALLQALDDKRLEVSLYHAAKAQASNAYAQPKRDTKPPRPPPGARPDPKTPTTPKPPKDPKAPADADADGAGAPKGRRKH